MQPAPTPEAPGIVETVSDHTGSLSRRMLLIGAVWIIALLLLGGVVLDRYLTSRELAKVDAQLADTLEFMILSAEIDPLGEVYFNSPLGDQGFLKPNSGSYWQVTGGDLPPFLSRSLWDEELVIRENAGAIEPIFFNSYQFAEQPLRVAQRTVQIPGSEVTWQFAVTASLVDLEREVADIRRTLAVSFTVLAVGLFLMVVVQTRYGLLPLRRVREAIARMRTTGANRITDPLPQEVQPLVEELNALLAHSVRQAEEARTHAGNLAHALKTPLTVLNNAASASSPDLGETVLREAAVMQRQVDHHLARARAVGRRAVGLSRAPVRESAEAVERAVARLYPHTRLDIAGPADSDAAVEKQDLEEMLGNLIENAAKYGGGSVFVTVDAEPENAQCVIYIEDDGRGIPAGQRSDIFGRGARLDTEKPGTGLGLAIVRDVAQIYGGDVVLDESEDLGGLLVKLLLPRAGLVA